MKTRIIAEVAQGYEGNPDYCYLYVTAAARAGADAVKFQITYADELCEPGYEFYEVFRRSEMDVSVWKKIKELADTEGIHLITDVLGPRALETAAGVRPYAIKIHSADFFNRQLIRQSFDHCELVFVGLGGLEMHEIRELVDEVSAWGLRDRLALLYGFQAVPTPVDKSSLARIPMLKAEFPDIQVGYMDHVPGDADDQIGVSLMALTLGAEWLEKHMTLSRLLRFVDYVSAIEPAEFAQYVASLRRLEKALGDGRLELSVEEHKYRDESIKKLLARTKLPAAHILVPEDLEQRRTPRIPPFNGFHDPVQVIGRRLKHALVKGEPILRECLE